MSDPSSSEDADVAAAQRGDVRAFERLFRSVQPPLLRYLRTMVGDDAADVASETWLRATRDLSRFRGTDDDFTGWVVTIGRHRALDHLRAARRRPSDPIDPTALPARTAPDDTFYATEEALATRRALDLIARLPQDQAEAVLLRVVVGLDAPAAAKVLGKRAGAVRMATSRGLARLQELIADQQGVTVAGSPAV
jgi:RNA polymerase sigma-70 factor (ECF subfamily)